MWCGGMKIYKEIKNDSMIQFMEEEEVSGNDEEEDRGDD